MNPLDLLAPRLTASPEPFTAPLSRLLVTRERDDGLAVRGAVYETAISRTALVTDLVLTAERGERLRVRRVRPDRIELAAAGASAHVCFADPDTLAVVCQGVSFASWRALVGVPGWPEGLRAVVVDGELTGTGAADTTWQARPHVAGGEMTVLIGAPGAMTPREGIAEQAQARWSDWFAAVARPQHGDPAAYLHAWWALAVNQVRLRGDDDLVAVVPSKVGYLGLWQWDAYFAAIGLRHGHGGLAQQQLELALRHQLADGQLPDVVHDEGILHSVDELPSGDRVRLAEHVGSRGGSDTGSALRAAVPVTKPPLGAWALAKLAAAHELGDFGADARSRLARAHAWWFQSSDPDGCGLPRYLHPYSSGIDDCPVWDFGTDIATPDLGSYLALDADALATLAAGAGRPSDADRWRQEADQVSALLTACLWDPARGTFGSRQGSRWLRCRTALDVLPLLTGRLSEVQLQAITTALGEATTFGTRHRVPTAALDDAAFDPEGMWRGPVWVNTNYLVVQGLRRSGRHDEADRLAQETLALVAGSPSIAEYWNPLTGQPAQRATAPFTWTAALYVDLAVTGGSIS